MPDNEWGPTFAGLAARCAASEIILAHVLATIACRDGSPKARIDGIFEGINAQIDELFGQAPSTMQLAEMMRERVSLVAAAALQILRENQPPPENDAPHTE